MEKKPIIKTRIKLLNTFLDLCGLSYSLGCSLMGRDKTDFNSKSLIKKEEIHRVLVIQLFALGDILLSLPLLKGLRKIYPETEIDFWIGKNWQEVGASLPYINKVITADSGNILKTIKLILTLRRKHYDMVFILYPVLTGSWLAFLVKARYRVGYTRDFDEVESLRLATSFLLTHPVPLGRKIIHDTQRYLNLAHHLELGITYEPPFLYPPSSTEDFLKNLLRHQDLSPQGPLIGINPNASWEGKRWPGPNFAQLADLLINEQKVQVLFLGSKGEREYVESIISLMKNKPLCAAGHTSLSQMAALIKACRLFISNDSGPLHMACALDVPTIGIMGPTKIEMFRPWSRLYRIIQNPLPCTPCEHENTTYCRHFSCISSIKVDSVYKAVLEVLKLVKS